MIHLVAACQLAFVGDLDHLTLQTSCPSDLALSLLLSQLSLLEGELIVEEDNLGGYYLRTRHQDLVPPAIDDHPYFVWKCMV